MKRATIVAALSAAVLACTAGATTPSGIVTYQFKASFGFFLDIHWISESGSRTKPCSSWTYSFGRDVVNASSLGRLRGLLRIRPVAPLGGDWAEDGSSGVGRAKVFLTRTRVDRSGTTACGSTRATENPAPENDCGKRDYETPVATLIPTERLGFRNLKEATTEPSQAFRLSLAAIRLAAPNPRGLPYQRCDMSRLAPAAATFPEVGFKVDTDDLRKLRNLGVGKDHRLEDTLSGHCQSYVAEGETCEFTLNVHVDMHRWSPDEPWP